MTIVEIAESIKRWLAARGANAGDSFSICDPLSVAIGTSKGMVRTDNQDRIIVARFSPARNANFGREFVFLGLCDGVGGGVDGARCAETTLATVVANLVMQSTTFDLGKRLYDSVVEANRIIYEQYRGHGGTTFSGVIFSPRGKIYVVNVGDSRIYKVETINKRRVVSKVTEDDTLAGELAKIRGDDIDSIAQEDFSRYLAQFIGVGDDIMPRVYDESTIGRDASLLITSDGVHSMPSETFHRLIENSQSAIDVVRRLIAVSSWLGGYDNASAIFMPAVSVSKSPPEESLDLSSLELWTAGVSTTFLLFGGLKSDGTHRNNKVQDDETRLRGRDAHYVLGDQGKEKRRSKTESKKKERRKKISENIVPDNIHEESQLGGDKKHRQLDIAIESAEDANKNDRRDD